MGQRDNRASARYGAANGSVQAGVVSAFEHEGGAMLDGLKNFAVDYWYKLLALVSVGVLVLALAVPLQVPNKPIVFMSLGGFLFALGQWINHPLQQRIGFGFRITGRLRVNHPGGVLTEIVGAALVGVGFWLLATG